jgi:RNA polymerase sigma-70 factor (ECF subfamily)
MNDSPHMGETDAKLVQRLQAGELEAFDVLFERHRRGLLAYVHGLLRDRARAEDIVQEAFLELVRRIAKINPRKSVTGWLYRVARNRAIDDLRRRKHETMPGDTAFRDRAGGRMTEPAESPAGRMMAVETRDALELALAQLPDKERDLLLLRFYGGLKFQEIAGILKRPLGTVLWQSRKSLAKLRKVMTAERE